MAHTMVLRNNEYFSAAHLYLISILGCTPLFNPKEMFTCRDLFSAIVAVTLVYSYFPSAFVEVTAVPLLDSRKEVDHNIFCGVSDPPAANEWPANATPRSQYKTLKELCGYKRGRPTVGCLCDSPYNRVECRPELGDPILYNAFLANCERDCYCAHATINWFDTSIAAVRAGGEEFVSPYHDQGPSEPMRMARPLSPPLDQTRAADSAIERQHSPT
ncbi:hypothetical protein MMC16_000103 [Acarospora aff. strigata]|nr:hypothetical protein [Acarospora aff. strigata]